MMEQEQSSSCTENHNGSGSSSSSSSSSSQLLATSSDINGEENFTQGCKFSPDGSCILTCTAGDHTLRLYNTLDAYSSSASPPPSSSSSEQNNSWTSALNVQEGDSVRSYAWYPHMDSNDVNSSIFLASAKDQPLHLFDAYTGKVRCSYRTYDAVDNLESAQSVAFTPDGERILAGFNRYIKMFHTNVPGREYDTMRLGKSRYSKDGQKGIVSAISYPTSSRNIFAVGTYAGSLYLYDDRVPSAIAADIVINGRCVVGHGKSNKAAKQLKRKFFQHNEEFSEDAAISIDDLMASAKKKWFEKVVNGGITQLTWSPGNDNLLFSASRRSNQIVCWDVRTKSGISSFARVAEETNQHIGFDLDDKRLYAGSRDNTILIYDITTTECVNSIKCADVVNGVSCFNSYDLIACSTGDRRFSVDIHTDDEDVVKDETNMGNIPHDDPPGSLQLYSLSKAKNSNDT